MNGQTQSGTLQIYLIRIVTFVWERAPIEGFARKNILAHSLISHPMLVLMTPKETDGHSLLCHRLLLVMDLNRLVHGF